MKKFLIPITINPSFWMVSFLLGWLISQDIAGGLLWVFVVLLSVYIHEMGHALTATCFHQKARIELNFLGGLTYRQGPDLTKFQEFIVVLMGPLSSLFLVAISDYCVHIESFSPSIHLIFRIFFIANLFWCALNLIPVLPLDGGRMMQIMLQALFGIRGERASYLVSAFSALALMVALLYFGQVLLGCFFLLFAFDSYNAWKQRRFQRSPSIERAIADEMMKAEGEWSTQHPDMAIERLEKVYEKMPSVDVIVKLANYLLMTEKPKKALYYLYKVEKRLTPEGLKLLQLAAYETMDWKKALEAGEKTFLEEGGDVTCALINAFSSARLAQVETSINWLISATKKGAYDMKKVLEAEDFDLIRKTPGFLEFLKSQYIS